MQVEQNTPVRSGKVRTMALVALFAALTGIFSQIQIPLPGMVPLSLATLAGYLAAMVLDWKGAFLSQVVYLLLGAVGIPVFSNFGTLSRLIGPTGGYLIGYAACALTAGLIMRITGKKTGWAVLALTAGTVVCYLLGTAWYVVVMKSGWIPALTACVIPFLPGDVVKILVGVLAGNRIRKALSQKV